MLPIFARRRNRRGEIVGLRRLHFDLLEDRRMLAIFMVNVAHDEVNGDGTPKDDGELTLRDAIQYVNGVTPGPFDNVASLIDRDPEDIGEGEFDTIVFNPTAFQSITDITIELEDPFQDGNGDSQSGELYIKNNVVIDASDLIAAGKSLTVTAKHGGDEDPGTGDGFRVFRLGRENGESPAVTLKHFTITGGDLSDDVPGSPDSEPSNGGGILDRGSSLTLEDMTITENYVVEKRFVDFVDSQYVDASMGFQPTGGGLFSSSTVVEIANSRIINNGAVGKFGGDEHVEELTTWNGIGESRGGGAYFERGNPQQGTIVTITDSTIDNNLAKINVINLYRGDGGNRGHPSRGGEPGTPIKHGHR